MMDDIKESEKFLKNFKKCVDKLYLSDIINS